jgi:hypothetical protein
MNQELFDTKSRELHNKERNFYEVLNGLLAKSKTQADEEFNALFLKISQIMEEIERVRTEHILLTCELFKPGSQLRVWFPENITRQLLIKKLKMPNCRPADPVRGFDFEARRITLQNLTAATDFRTFLQNELEYFFTNTVIFVDPPGLPRSNPEGKKFFISDAVKFFQTEASIRLLIKINEQHRISDINIPIYLADSHSVKFDVLSTDIVSAHNNYKPIRVQGFLKKQSKYISFANGKKSKLKLTIEKGEWLICTDPNWICLAHELIHALHFAKNKYMYYCNFSSFNGYSENLLLSFYDDPEELVTINRNGFAPPVNDDHRITESLISVQNGSKFRVGHRVAPDLKQGNIFCKIFDFYFELKYRLPVGVIPKLDMSKGRIDLSEVNLSGINLSGINSPGINSPGINSSGIILNLCRANLTGANLSHANLAGVNLNCANLTGANLTGANLTGAHVLYINLTGANLTGANLTGVNLMGAILTGAMIDGDLSSHGVIIGPDGNLQYCC